MEHFLTREYLWPARTRSRSVPGRLLWMMQNPSNFQLNRGHHQCLLPYSSEGIRHWTRYTFSTARWSDQSAFVVCAVPPVMAIPHEVPPVFESLRNNALDDVPVGREEDRRGRLFRAWERWRNDAGVSGTDARIRKKFQHICSFSFTIGEKTSHSMRRVFARDAVFQQAARVRVGHRGDQCRQEPLHEHSPRVFGRDAA